MNEPATTMSEDEFNERAMMRDANPEKALFWLAAYADEIGNAYGRMKHADIERKVVCAEQYDKMLGTNKDREMSAIQSREYREACDRYENACADYMRLNVLKEAAVLKIGVWQSKVKAGLEGNP